MIAVIPARGGSKGIPRKNIKEFCGRPLVAWTIEAARESGVLARVIVSTDDREIAEVARDWGGEVPFLRPSYLAQDLTPTAPVIQHAISWLNGEEHWAPDAVFVLEPTAPARRPFHIVDAARLLERTPADSVASVCEIPHHYHPSKVLRLEANAQIVALSGVPIRDLVHRRQDLSKYYALDGLVFACRTQVLTRDIPTLWGDKVLGMVVDPKYNVDLDRPEDWVPAEAKVKAILEEEARGARSH